MSGASYYQALESTLGIVNSRQGRDKVCRVIQYFIKFVLPTLESQGERYSLFITKVNKLHDSMSLTRKVLRFGKQLPLLKNIINRV